MKKRILLFLCGFLPLILLNLIEGISTLLMVLFAHLGALFRGSSGFERTMTYQTIISNDDFGTMIMILYSLISILIFGLWYYMRCDGEYGKKAVREFHPVLFAGIVCMVPGLQLVSSFVCILIELINPAAMESYAELIDSAGISDASLILLIYSVVLAPLCEELAFRGVTMRLFHRVIPSFWIVNLLQAFLFGIFHGNLVQGTYAFCLGLFLGYVCKKGGTIYYSITLHVIFNFWGTVVSAVLESMNLPDMMYLLIELGMLFCLIAGILIFKIGLNERDQEEEWYQEAE